MASVVNNDENNPNNSQVQSQGLGMGQSPQQKQPAAKGTAPSSGQFQNFQNYQQANKQAGQRIGNLLASNVGQQQQSVQASAESAKSGMKTGVQSEQERIKQGLENVRQANQTGNFSNFFNQQNQQNFGVQGQSQYNPVSTGLSDWASKLSSGQTNLADLSKQAQASTGLAARQQDELIRRQQALGTEAGRFQMLRDILGKSGSYSNPAQRLDQALFQTNTKQLSDVQNKAMQQVALGQKTLDEAKAEIEAAKSSLQGDVTKSKEELFGVGGQDGLLKQGLSSLDTNLEAAKTAAREKRKSEVEDISKQFKDQEFSEDTLGQLGVQEGTTLFNILQDQANRDKYLQTANPEDIQKSNVMDLAKLEQYSALNKMLGLDPSQFEYQNVGKVDPSYNIKGDQFKKDLASLYNTRADQADSDVVSGYAEEVYKHGLFNSATDYERALYQMGVKDRVDSNALRQAATDFGKLKDLDRTASTENATSMGTNSQMDAFGKGMMSGVGALASGGTSILKDPGAFAKNIVGGVGGVINNLYDAFTGQNDKKRHASEQAQLHAKQALQSNWENYLNQQGYSNTAKLRKQLQDLNKLNTEIPKGLQG